MKKNKTGFGYLLNTIVIILLFTAFQIITGIFGSHGSFKLVVVPCLWQCCYLIILAASLNLVLGFLGQLSLGHCGFMAIGAYTAALLSLACERAGLFEDKEGAVFILILFGCIIAAGILAALVGLLVGVPTWRIIDKNLLPYLVSVITMRMALAIPSAIGNEVFVTYIGIGLPVDTPSLGNLIQTGRSLMTVASLRYQLFFPVLVLVLITTSFYIIGNAFADAADPKNHVK